jgi:hypothetical protein
MSKMLEAGKRRQEDLSGLRCDPGGGFASHGTAEPRTLMPMISVQQTGKPGEPRLIDRLARIGRTVVLTFFVIASLLTFPASIPWMVACWLFWHSLLVFRNRPGWLPLAACVVILCVKRVA